MRRVTTPLHVPNGALGEPASQPASQPTAPLLAPTPVRVVGNFTTHLHISQYTTQAASSFLWKALSCLSLLPLASGEADTMAQQSALSSALDRIVQELRSRCGKLSSTRQWPCRADAEADTMISDKRARTICAKPSRRRIEVSEGKQTRTSGVPTAPATCHPPRHSPTDAAQSWPRPSSQTSTAKSTAKSRASSLAGVTPTNASAASTP